MKRIRQCMCRASIVTGLLLLGTGSGTASPPIDELFSNADGTLQFIQLIDVAPGQLAGMSLIASHADGARTFVFPPASGLGVPRGNYLVIASRFNSPTNTSTRRWGGIFSPHLTPRSTPWAPVKFPDGIRSTGKHIAGMCTRIARRFVEVDQRGGKP